jgi:hypothetical protein
MATRPVRTGSIFLAATLLPVTAASALAQPWVPPPGEGTVSVTYQNYYVKGHWVGPQRTKTDNGGTHSKSLVAELDWGLPRSLGLTVNLPFIWSKYTGSSVYFVNGVETTPGPLDDGFYHGAFQDLHAEVRRAIELGRVAVAPLAGFSLPSHEYVTQGEAVPGRHRTEFQVGAIAGTDISKWLPSGYIHGRYALSAAEKIDGLPSLRSLIDVEAGSEITRRLGWRGLATWQIRHKGPTQSELIAHGWKTHDRFVVSNYFNLGGGMTIRLNRSTELSGAWTSAISGNLGAHIAQLLNVSLTRQFGGGSAVNGLGR